MERRLDTMETIRQTFFEECGEQLGELEAGLLAMEAGASEAGTVDAVFRAVHSIKGGAGAFDLAALVHLAHAFESSLDALRTGRMTADRPMIGLMLRAADQLADLVRACREGSPPDSRANAAMVAALAAATAAGSAGSAAPEPIDFIPVMVDLAAFPELMPASGVRRRITFTPRPALYAKGNETAVLLREVDRLGTMRVACDVAALPPLDMLDPEGAYLTWTVDLSGIADAEAVAEVFDFAALDGALTIENPDAPAAVPEQPSTAAAPPPMSVPVPATPATVRVELDRVDRLINLAGELVINQAMLSERVEEVGLSRRSAVCSGLTELEQLTRDIQDGVMAIRAQPVRAVFQRLPRLVREVAAATGKCVRLVTEGEGTEVDNTIIEQLSGPLVHMVRNAIDHGLEDPATRRARGKPAEGRLRIAAAHRSGRIVIEVSDDGQGIDRARVRAVAVARKLVAAEAVMSEDEIDNLIFLPGFSTAATVSDISGRGVGLDVVKRSVQALGGRIVIASRPGEGSTFTLSLPLTLAVLDGMVLSVAAETFVVPLSAVVEILMPRDVVVHGLGGEAEVLGLRGGFVPLVDVGRKLGLRATPLAPRDGVVLLVETEAGRRCGLVVDAIQGQRQVVIKSLDAGVGPVPGIAAATILGDGRVALILDVGQLPAPLRPNPAIDVDHPEAPAVGGPAASPREVVTFLVGRHEFCVDIMSVREIRGWTPATPLPHTPPALRGVVNLRGTVLPIVDLALKLDLPAATPGARHVIIVVQSGARTAGLLVDAVTGIMGVGDGTIQAPPEAAASAPRGAIRGLIAIDDRLVSLVGLDGALPGLHREAA